MEVEGLSEDERLSTNGNGLYMTFVAVMRRRTLQVLGIIRLCY
jgi:hypothetical protein